MTEHLPSPTRRQRAPLDRDDVLQRAQTVLDEVLRDGQPAIRKNACGALHEVDATDLADALLQRLRTDPDPEVRACAAVALALSQVSESRPVIDERYPDAAPAQQVWYAYALHKFGTGGAIDWLRAHAEDENLDVSLRAALWLAELSRSGASEVTALVHRLLARRYAEIKDVDTRAPLMLLAQLTRLGVDDARDKLYAMLDDEDFGVRLAASEALVEIGDDHCVQTLQVVRDDGTARQRLRAVFLLARLGEFAGEDALARALADGMWQERVIAARAHAEFGGTDDLRVLSGLLDAQVEGDPRVRAAAAAGVLLILKADPVLLAAAVSDWARAGIASENWATRASVARSLANLPAEQVIPILDQAIVDEDPRVRTESARSAGSMRGSLAAAMIVADRLLDEPDKDVQAEKVIAIARIGRAEVKAALKPLANQKSRVGILSFGALLALGESEPAQLLHAAYRRGRTRVRLAVMEAAMLAESALLVPTLQRALADRVFAIRFQAAEAMARLAALGRDIAERAAAVAALRVGLDQEPTWLARALRGLSALGEAPAAEQAPDALLKSPEPAVRLAALAILNARPLAEHMPAWRTLTRDMDDEVRREVVAALDGRADDPRQTEKVRQLLKTLTRDLNDEVKNRSKGILASLPALVEFAPRDEDITRLDDGDVVEQELQRAQARVRALGGNFDEQAQALEEALEAIDAHIGAPIETDADMKRAEEMAEVLATSVAQLAELSGELQALRKEAPRVAHRDGAESEALLASVDRYAVSAPVQVAEMRERVEKAREAVEKYLADGTADCEHHRTAVETASNSGNVRKAKRELVGAEKNCRAPAELVSLAFTRALYHDAMARASSGDKAARYQEKALRYYQRYQRSGKDKRKKAHARERERAILMNM